VAAVVELYTLGHMNTPGLFSRLTFALTLGLGIWVGVVAGVIEFQNARADFYLPRRDLHDGKWRISIEGADPRDRLRGLVSGVGLLQYLLAPLCIILGIVHSLREREAWRRRVAFVCWVVGSVAFVLAAYRGYLSSID
jgi:hypothetical protein